MLRTKTFNVDGTPLREQQVAHSKCQGSVGQRRPPDTRMGGRALAQLAPLDRKLEAFPLNKTTRPPCGHRKGALSDSAFVRLSIRAAGAAVPAHLVAEELAAKFQLAGQLIPWGAAGVISIMLACSSKLERFAPLSAVGLLMAVIVSGDPAHHRVMTVVLAASVLGLGLRALDEYLHQHGCTAARMPAATAPRRSSDGRHHPTAKQPRPDLPRSARKKSRMT